MAELGCWKPFGISNISGEPLQIAPAQLLQIHCSVVHDEVNTNTLDSHDIPHHLPAAG